ncbi:hypothetical protein HED51_13950 [Ochrobactrum grignonense]|nr:hypothetical protein [Brucella grignonensis]
MRSESFSYLLFGTGTKMRSSTDKTNKNHSSVREATTYTGSDHHTEMINSTKGCFTYGVTEIGQHVYVSDQTLGIILLEPIRNLRWKSGGGGEFISSYVAGTAFIIPAKQTLEICWTEPAEYLRLTIPTIVNPAENEKTVRLTRKVQLAILSIFPASNVCR